MTATQIPAPRVPFLDPRTGQISREWYRFFLIAVDETGTDGGSLHTHVSESRDNISVDNDIWHIICASNPSIALQAASDRSSILTVTNAGSGVVSISPVSGELISGKTILTLNHQWSTVQLLPYSAGYVII